MKRLYTIMVTEQHEVAVERRKRSGQLRSLSLKSSSAPKRQLRQQLLRRLSSAARRRFC